MAKKKKDGVDGVDAGGPDMSKVVLEGGREIDVPEGWALSGGVFPQRFEFEGKLYEHVSDDDAGRWVYRAWL